MSPLIRTQMQLRDDQLEALRRLSGASGRSMSALIRGAVDQMLASRRTLPATELKARGLGVVGRFASGDDTGAEEHDRHLSRAFAE